MHVSQEYGKNKVCQKNLKDHRESYRIIHYIPLRMFRICTNGQFSKQLSQSV